MTQLGGVGDLQLVGQLGFRDQHAQVGVRRDAVQLVERQAHVERDRHRAEPQRAVDRGQGIDAVGQQDADAVPGLDA